MVPCPSCPVVPPVVAPPPCPVVPPKCNNGICCPRKVCPAPPACPAPPPVVAPPPCPALPTVCDGIICKKPVKDQLDVIKERGLLKVSYPAASIPGFVSLDPCPICTSPQLGGYLGFITRAISTAIFGRYTQSNTKLVLTSGNEKFQSLYHGTADLDVSFTIPINKARTFNANGAAVSRNFDSVSHMETFPALTIDPAIYKVCNICQNLDLKGKVIRAAFKKIGLNSAATNFVIVSNANTVSEKVAVRMRMAFGSEFKQKTGLDLVVGLVSGGSSSVGTSQSVSVNGVDSALNVDAFVGTDFVLQMYAPNVVKLSAADRSTYNLDLKDQHAISFANAVRDEHKNDKLQDAVNMALSCLQFMKDGGVNRIDDLATADPWVKHKIEDNAICHNILQYVGSLGHFDASFATDSLIDYTIMTTSVGLV